jgi:hypothetical protein
MSGWAKPMASYRLIFLDIDGVLNNVLLHGRLSDPLVTAFASLVRETGAAVVLSSAWRLKRHSRQRIKEAFMMHGVPLFISCTPQLYSPHGSRYARVSEILAWLQLNTTIQFRPEDLLAANGSAEYVTTEGQFSPEDYTLPYKINVTHFVALDDIDMRKLGQQRARQLVARRHFVLTMMRTGVTAHNLAQAGHILSDQYGAIDMLSTTTQKGTTLINENDEEDPAMYKLMLPLCRHCEKCGRTDLLPTLYDMEVNKYFCVDACRKEFYLLYCSDNDYQPVDCPVMSGL